MFEGGGGGAEGTNWGRESLEGMERRRPLLFACVPSRELLLVEAGNGGCVGTEGLL